MIKLFKGDVLEIFNSKEFLNQIKDKQVIIVTDPPFNIGYKYNSYKDKMKEEAYYNRLNKIVNKFNSPYVLIHYPESLFKLSIKTQTAPTRVVSWVYNSNTSKQHRDIAFFNIVPNFKQVIQPYKNLTDKRIKERMARGIMGGKLYDWWNINQVKNVSKKDKINHPCVMPVQVMKNTIGILPIKDKENTIVIDPFMGSGTTGIACKELGINFIGIELDEKYFELANERINNETRN